MLNSNKFHKTGADKLYCYLLSKTLTENTAMQTTTSCSLGWMASAFIAIWFSMVKIGLLPSGVQANSINSLK